MLPPPISTRGWRWAHALVVLATLLAAVMRWVAIDTLPPQAWYDEIWFALRARDLLQGALPVAHYGIENTAGNAGLVYLTALANLVGIVSIASARVAPAVAGVIAVPLVAACVRELLAFDPLLPPSFNRRVDLTAGLSALIAAILPMDVILSRVGMEPALAPPVALFAVWQVMRAMRRKDWTGWALAGLVMGLAQYLGPHARFVIPLVGIVILERLLNESLRLRFSRRAILIGAAVMVGVAALVTAPLAVTFVQHPEYLTGRAEDVSVAPGELPANALRVLGAFTFVGDANPRHNVPGSPILDPVLSIGFAAGLGWVAWRARRSPAARILLAWLLLMTLPSMLTAEAPNFGRMVGVVPPAVVLAVLGWIAIAAWSGRQRAVRPPVFRSICGILAAASLVWSITAVFVRWPQTSGLDAAFTRTQVDLGRMLAERAEAGEPVFADRLPGIRDVAAFEYFFDGSPVTRVDFDECIPYMIETDRRANVLLLQPAAYATHGELATVGILEYVTTGLGVDAALALPSYNLGFEGSAWLVETGAGQPVEAPLPPERPAARFDSGISLAAYASSGWEAAGPLRLALYWDVLTTPPADLTMFLHIQPSGVDGLPPVAQHDAPPCGWLHPTSEWQPGERVLDWFTIPLPPELPPGDYDLVVGWYDPETLQRVRLVEADRSLPDDRAVIATIHISPDAP